MNSNMSHQDDTNSTTTINEEITDITAHSNINNRFNIVMMDVDNNMDINMTELEPILIIFTNMDGKRRKTSPIQFIPEENYCSTQNCFRLDSD